mgnify:CR=1 FL=1
MKPQGEPIRELSRGAIGSLKLDEIVVHIIHPKADLIYVG